MAASKYMPFFDELVGASLWRIATRLPGLVVSALRWAWRASPRDTAATVLLNIAAGVFAAISLVAVAGVLESLFSAAPTAERVLAALPSLAVVASAALAQGGLHAAAGWAQARLRPHVERQTELRLFELTARIRLESFDDSDFNDAMYRARDRGLFEVAQVISHTIDVLTAAIGLIAVAGVLAVLHPVLVLLLVVTVLPVGWAATKAARMRYVRQRELSTSRRRRWVLGDLLASRDSAAELQEYTRWPMTAERNVTMASATHPDRLARAAHLSGADTVVADLPHGWETILDPSFATGVNLSGGQWQRVAGARGLYRTADLLIVDEPTAALDARAEHNFFEALRRHAHGRTVLLITHRLASVRMADRIYVLHKGAVTEHGTHQDLMASGGLYSELYALQARSFETGHCHCRIGGSASNGDEPFAEDEHIQS